MLPGTGIVPAGADVTLNVFVPVLNKFDGFGSVFGSLKKKEPIKSPQLSLTNFTFATLAIAPLVKPTNLTFFLTYP